MGKKVLTAQQRQQVRSLYKQYRSASKVADLLGVNTRTVLRWVTDLIQPTDTQWVVEVRRRVKEDPSFDLTAYAKEKGMARTTLRRALSGRSYQHLNNVEPGGTRASKKSEKQEEARALCRANISLRLIAKQLSVAKSSASLWCKDILEERRQREAEEALAHPTIKQKKKWKPQPKKERDRNGPQVLTNETVIDLRRIVRADNLLRLGYHAARLGVSASAIRDAVKGITFKAVDEIEPPVTHRLGVVPRKPRTIIPSVDLIEEAIALRRSSPDVYTYKALSQWMREKTGRKYGQIFLANLMLGHDPSLKELDAKPIKPKKVSAPKKKMSVAEIAAKMKEHQESRNAFALLEDQYEQWVKEGSPDYPKTRSR